LLAVSTLTSQLFSTGCSADRDAAALPGSETSVGKLGLALALDPATQLSSVHYEISSTNFFTSGDIDVTGQTELRHVIPQLPEGQHRIELSGQSPDGSATCEGTGSVDVKAHKTTAVRVQLQCKLSQRTGTVLVKGQLNVCPALVSAAA